MKLTAGAPQQINVKPIISTDKFSIVAERGMNNLIAGFKVTVFAENKAVYFPVTGKSAKDYSKAWTSVYNLVKKHI